MAAAPLSQKQLRVGIQLARAEADCRWAWGDWALDVAGPLSEHGVNDGSREKLVLGLDYLKKAQEMQEGDLALLPDTETLRHYREAAATVPPDLRRTVRSIEASRLLGQQVKDPNERLKLINTLKKRSKRGIVTLDALRQHFGRAPTNTGKQQASRVGQIGGYRPPTVRFPKTGSTPEAKAAVQQQREQEEKAIIAAHNTTRGQVYSVPAAYWAILQKTDEVARDLVLIADELARASKDPTSQPAIQIRKKVEQIRDACELVLSKMAPPKVVPIGRRTESNVIEVG